MTTDLVAGVLFLAPGFLALKLFYLLGAQRKRSEWEWTTWSVIASLPITGLASLARDYFSSARTDPDPIEVVLRMLIGAAAGVVCGVVWAGIRHSKRDVAGDLRTFFGSSAWDEALEDVGREGRQVELVLEDGLRLAGTIRYGGREDNEAEGWLYLIFPEVFDEELDAFRAAKSHGYLVHRDRIKRVRVMEMKSDSARADKKVVRVDESVGK